MFLKNLSRLRQTLAFRLTLWYAGIFTLSSLAAFLIFYLLITSIIQEHTNEVLLEETSEFADLLSSKGMDAIKNEIVHESKSEGVEEIFFRILTLDGKEIASSDLSSWHGLNIDNEILTQLAQGSGPVLKTLEIPGHEHKVRTVYGKIGTDIILQMGQSLEKDDKFIEAFRNIFGVTLPVIMLFAALIGWFMVRRALLGVEQVTQTAIEISNGAMERRVPVKARGDEIDRLANTFNHMLDRIHTLIIGIREMTDNIAHDLRSPLTIIRGNAEMALTNVMSSSEYETMAANTVEECDRLLGMINTMLDITEVESGSGKRSMEQIDIAQMARDACDLFQPMAEDQGITMNSDIPPACVIHGDSSLLQRMMANLLDNALKYTPSQGTVKISVKEVGTKIVISVCDTGIGISGDDQPHIFKRFYRCDRSRSQAGSGLGLSLAQAIARAHGGHITTESSPGNGSTFTITLPKRPSSQVDRLKAED